MDSVENASRGLAHRALRALLLALVIAIAPAIVIPSAWGLETRKKSTIVGPGRSFVSVKCGPERKAISGGFAQTARLRVYESRKAGPRRWRASGLNATTRGVRPKAFARCGARARRTKPRRGAIKVASGQTAKVSARCHRGERLLSGGFANPDFDADRGPQMFPHISRRAGKKHRWTVVAHNLGTGPGTLVAFAYCRGR